MNAGLFRANEVAIVTGGGSGIGAATALLLAREGARVVVADRDASAAAEVAARILSAGGSAMARVCDVADDDQCDALVAAALERYGRLDCAVNNAGVAPPLVETADIDPRDVDLVDRVNLRGVWACMAAELRHFREVRAGTIVNTASVAGVVGNPLSAMYSATKHGVVGLTRTAALEYGGRGIRVNAVAPGLTRTPMVERLAAEDPAAMAGLEAAIPLGRAARSDEIAEAVVWLCSSRSSFVTGHVLVVDGGYTAG